MGFDALLGNDRLKQNLTGALARGRIAHFYLISGPAGSGKRTLARLLAAAILCTEPGKPCCQCAACKKVLSNVHPDLITVDDTDHVNLPVEVVRNARADMYIRPNEAEHKIYLFPRAQNMRVEAQNALLKILEEPPSYGVFILLTDNPQAMLPTVRSRCTELAMTALPEHILTAALKQAYPQADVERLSGAVCRSGGYLGQAMQIMEEAEDASEVTVRFLESYIRADALALLQVLSNMEKWKREQLIQELQRWLQVISNALAARNGIAPTQLMAAQLSTARSAADLMEAVRVLKKAILYAQGNVSGGAICGWLQWQLR